MKNWRDHILDDISSGNHRTTVVLDPDELLLDERILAEISLRRIELISYDDEVNFRFLFESRFRGLLESGANSGLCVVIRSSEMDFEKLPFDIVSSSRRLAFDLASIFPNLSYQVVASLPKGDLDSLYQACGDQDFSNLSINSSMDFALLHVYKVAPELIKQPEDLLKFLLRKHYINQSIPGPLLKRFSDRLRKNPCLDEWPIETILGSRNSFLEFIQERWPIFVKRFPSSSIPGNDRQFKETPMKYSGPVDLPFDSHEVKFYLDNMFIEGLLKPVDCDEPNRPLPQWVAMGVKNSEFSHILHKLELLLANIEKMIPDGDAAALEWQSFAGKWAELSILINEGGPDIPASLSQRISSAERHLDANFETWMMRRYSGLNSMAPFPPMMVSHIPRYLARLLKDNTGSRTLFILVDGMSMEQWLSVRRVMERDNPRLYFEQNAVFTWAPSLTSFSRQSAFAGRAPLFFPSSIFSTDREKSHWTTFWIDQGLRPDEIGFEKYVQSPDEDSLARLLDNPSLKALGLILTQVDSIMHGACLGAAGMMEQVRLWASQGNLSRIVEKALKEGFDVHVSSDHGNIESVGIGRPLEGVEAELRGQRVRIFDNAQSRSRVKLQFPDTIEWAPTGLPETCQALFATGRSAFVAKGDRVVTHGGLSMQEIIVPFVRVGLT